MWKETVDQNNQRLEILYDNDAKSFPLFQAFQELKNIQLGEEFL